jgi:hypothetical protein
LVGDVPAAEVTVTSTTPVPAGETAVMVVLFTTEYELAATEPKFTDWAPVNPLPEMVTVVPPAAGPWFGLMLVTDVAIAATVAEGGDTTNVVESLAPLVAIFAEICSGAGWLDEQPLGGVDIPVSVTVKVAFDELAAIWL